jgi:hypothetical protein
MRCIIIYPIRERDNDYNVVESSEDWMSISRK